MPSDFAQMIADTKREAQREGPQAVRELEQFRKEFRSASAHVDTNVRSRNNLGNKLRETQEHPNAENQMNPGLIN